MDIRCSASENSHRLVLGTAQFGKPYGINNSSGCPTSSEVSLILDWANQAGVTMLDTAEAYGEANIRLRDLFRRMDYSRRNNYQVIAKFHLEPGSSVKQKIQELLAFFEGINVWCIQFHRVQDLSYGSLSELVRYREDGYFQKIGVSLYSNQEIEQCLAMPDIDVLQIPYNVLDNRRQREQWLARARDLGKEICARSVFLQGLFLMDPYHVPPALQPLKPWLLRIRDTAHACFGPGHTGVLRLSLAYCLGDPLIQRVLVGVEKLDQWVEILQASQVSLPKGVREEIDAWTVDTPHLLNPVNWSHLLA